jgi:hypothetical protein
VIIKSVDKSADTLEVDWVFEYFRLEIVTETGHWALLGTHPVFIKMSLVIASGSVQLLDLLQETHRQASLPAHEVAAEHESAHSLVVYAMVFTFDKTVP